MAWRRRHVIAALTLLVAGVLLGRALDRDPALLIPLEDAVIEQAEKAGLVVERVTVTGLKRTGEEAFLEALAIDFGTAIIPLDLEGARTRIETLPWIKTATVRRVLPDQLSVSVVERRPYAIWQHAGQLELIDPEGTIIPGRDLARFADLPLIVGADAPLRCDQLFDLFATEPDLAGKVRAAILVGGRRWDVEFRSGLRVMLPAPSATYGPEAAWARLAAIERGQMLNGQHFERLDLRLPDRIVIGGGDVGPAGFGRRRDTT